MVNTRGKYTFLITADIHVIEIQQDSSTEYARTLFKHLYLMIVFIKYATRTLYHHLYLMIAVLIGVQLGGAQPKS